MGDLGGAPVVGSAPSSGSTAPAGALAATRPERRGIVFDQWPFRLDVDTEYQDWVLVLVCVLLAGTWALPCICGRMQNDCSRAFTNWVYTRLHIFFCIVTYVNLIMLMFTLGVLPDWSVSQFVRYFVLFVTWVLVHLQKMIISAAIICGFYLLFRFRERIALAAGIEHVTMVRWNWKDVFGFHGKKRPIELFIWKVAGLQSSSSKVLKANDIYVECHMGRNEPMRTRVHNNAGSGCVIKQSFQMNIDEGSASTLLFLLVKDQSLVNSSELARLMLSTRELRGIEDRTGKRRQSFTYSQEHFVELKLSPGGTIWLAVAPVEDGDAVEERAPLMSSGDDDLVTC